jgi:hypothetical protein
MSIADINAAVGTVLTNKDWVDRVEAAGWTQLGTSGVYYTRKNGMISLVGRYTSAGGTLGTLPAGYRHNSPAGTINFQLWDSAAASNLFTVSTAGVITVTATGPNTVDVPMITYPAEH